MEKDLPMTYFPGKIRRLTPKFYSDLDKVLIVFHL